MKGVAELTAHRFGVEAERPAAWRDLEDGFGFAIGQVGLDLADPRIALQQGTYFLRRRLERRHLVTRQAHIDLASRRPAPGRRDRQGVDPGQRTHRGTPGGNEVGGAHVSLVGGLELQGQATEVVSAGAPTGGVRVGRDPGAYLRHHKSYQAAGTVGQLPFGGLSRALQLLQHGLGLAARAAGNEGDVGVDPVGFRGRKEVKADPAAQHHAKSHDQPGHGGRQRGVPPFHAKRDRAPERTVAEPCESGIEAAPETAGGGGSVAEGAAQMAGKNEEALDQAGNQHRRHHERYGVDDLTDDAADHIQRHEGGDGGQRGGNHRRRHAPGPEERRLGRRQAFPELGLAVLADHDRVVDDDAEHHDHAEQADHVDRLAADQHDHQRRHERDRDAGRDPEGDAAVQEQEQDADHQDQPAHAVVDQHPDTLADELGHGVVSLDLEIFRRTGAKSGDVSIDDLGQLQGVIVDRALNVQLDRRLPPELGRGRGVVEAFAHSCDVAEHDLLAVVERANLEGAQGARVLEQAQATDLAHRCTLGIAGWHVLRGTGDARRHLGQGQVQPAQHRRRDFHPDLFVAGAEQVDLVDPRRQQLVAHALGNRL